MTPDLPAIRDLLARTPAVLDAWLRGLPEEWIRAHEGPDTWSPFDIVGHLIQGEKKDWIARARIILERGPARAFDPFDRFAQLEEDRGKTLEELLGRFAALRRENLAALDALAITPEQLAREGRHPELGAVTLGQLLTTWAVHDLGHIAQIARVLAKGHQAGVGPWAAYLPILGPPRV